MERFTGNSRTVAVTGANGFLGQHLVTALLSEGATVVALDGPLNDRQEITAAQHSDDLDLSRLIRAPFELVTSTPPGSFPHGVDIVCHLAGMSHVEGVARDPYAGYLINVLGAVHTAQAAIEAGVSRFVFASSATVYGEVCSSLLTERHATDAVTLYAKTKLLAEQNLALLSDTTQMQVVNLRLAHLYGPGQAANRTIPAFILEGWQSARTEGGRGPITVPISSGRIPSDDFVYVGDAADAFVKAALTPLPAQTDVFNISSGVSTSLSDIAEMAARVIGVEKNLRLSEEEDYWSRALDNRRAIEHLGWKPGTSLIEGIELTVAAYEHIVLADAIRGA